MKRSVEHFWARVDVRSNSECWEWQGGLGRKGYGRLELGGVRWQAHRLAYTLEVAEIEPGMFICHHCDNPPCCNPAHLYQGTHTDNMADAAARDRLKTHVFSLDQKADIVRRYATKQAGQAELAREYGVGQATISRLLGGVRRVPQAPARSARDQAIRDRYLTSDITLDQIAAEFGVSQATVSRAIA